jgi:hypothetical protein
MLFSTEIALFCFILFYFVGKEPASSACICVQAVNSDYILNVLETAKFVFCLQIYALADRTMNSKFSILHSASPRAVLKISRSLYDQRVRIFVNKTLTAVSNP